MYERFSENVRRAMIIASEEAQRFEHPRVGTAHILVGIFKVGGLGAEILNGKGIDLSVLRDELHSIIHAIPDEGPRLAMVREVVVRRWRRLWELLGEPLPMGISDSATQTWIGEREREAATHPGPGRQQSRNALLAFELAIAEARNLQHNYVGTEHLILGLMRAEEGTASQLLRCRGLDVDTLRQTVVAMLGQVR